MRHCFLLSCMTVILFQKKCKGFQVKGSAQPIVAVVGDDVILPCQLEPQTDAVAMIIEWFRQDLKPKYVHIYRDRQEVVAFNNPSYKSRAALFRENMKTGNISLKLSRVTVSDTGIYTCSTPTTWPVKKTQVQLSVYSVSEPVIAYLEPKDAGVVLQCKVRSYDFKPAVKWMEKDGPKILNAHTEIVRDPEGHYNVTSTVTVHQTASNTFICRVESREKEITVPDLKGQVDRKPNDGSNQIGHPVVVVVAMLLLLVMMLVVEWRCHRHRRNHGGERKCYGGISGWHYYALR